MQEHQKKRYQDTLLWNTYHIILYHIQIQHARFIKTLALLNRWPWSNHLQVALKSLDQTYVWEPNWGEALMCQCPWRLEPKLWNNELTCVIWCFLFMVLYVFLVASSLPIMSRYICRICVWPNLTTFVLFLHQGAANNSQLRTFSRSHLSLKSELRFTWRRCLLASNDSFVLVLYLDGAIASWSRNTRGMYDNRYIIYIYIMRQYDMILITYGMTWYNMIQYYTVWFNMIQYADIYVYVILVCATSSLQDWQGMWRKHQVHSCIVKGPANTLFQLDAMIIPNEIHVFVTTLENFMNLSESWKSSEEDTGLTVFHFQTLAGLDRAVAQFPLLPAVCKGAQVRRWRQEVSSIFWGDGWVKIGFSPIWIQMNYMEIPWNVGPRHVRKVAASKSCGGWITLKFPDWPTWDVSTRDIHRWRKRGDGKWWKNWGRCQTCPMSLWASLWWKWVRRLGYIICSTRRKNIYVYTVYVYMYKHYMYMVHNGTQIILSNVMSQYQSVYMIQTFEGIQVF